MPDWWISPFWMPELWNVWAAQIKVSSLSGNGRPRWRRDWTGMTQSHRVIRPTALKVFCYVKTRLLQRPHAWRSRLVYQDPKTWFVAGVFKNADKNRLRQCSILFILSLNKVSKTLNCLSEFTRQICGFAHNRDFIEESGSVIWR